MGVPARLPLALAPTPILRLDPGAGVDPHPHRHRPHVGHGLGDEANAVGENGLPVAFGHYEAPDGATLSCSFSASAG